MVWSSRYKFLLNPHDPVVVIFFEKNIYVRKITRPEIINSELMIFRTQTFFCKKKIKTTGSYGFPKNFTTIGSDHQLWFFFAFFKKNYDRIKSFSKSKWTGLKKESQRVDLHIISWKRSGCCSWFGVTSCILTENFIVSPNTEWNWSELPSLKTR